MSQLLPERRAAAPERWEPLREFEQVTERMQDARGEVRRLRPLAVAAAGDGRLVAARRHRRAG